MKKRLLLAALICVLTSCKKAPNFPGYTKLGTDSSGQTYFVNLDTVERHSGVVQFSLLIQQQQTEYSIITLATNCKGMLKRLGGTQYAADGTMLRNVAADRDASRTEISPQLTPAITAACNRASAMRFLPGQFQLSEAMDLLFGNYNPSTRASRWNDIRTQAPEFGENSGNVTPYFDAAYTEAGLAKHIILTATVPDGEFDCHACAPLTSAFVFVEHGGKWFPEVEQYDLRAGGSWGKPPETKLVKLGPDAYGITLSMSYTAQGESASTTDILAPSSSGFVQALSLTTEQDNAGACGPSLEPCYSTQISYQFVTGQNGEFYDIVATESGTELRDDGQVVPIAGTKRYSFASGKYQLKS